MYWGLASGVALKCWGATCGVQILCSQEEAESCEFSPNFRSSQARSLGDTVLRSLLPLWCGVFWLFVCSMRRIHSASFRFILLRGTFSVRGYRCGVSPGGDGFRILLSLYWIQILILVFIRLNFYPIFMLAWLFCMSHLFLLHSSFFFFFCFLLYYVHIFKCDILLALLIFLFYFLNYFLSSLSKACDI